MGNMLEKTFRGNNPRKSSVMPLNQTKKSDDVLVNRLRDDLNEEAELFILNHILTSIQFYENFER